MEATMEVLKRQFKKVNKPRGRPSRESLLKAISDSTVSRVRSSEKLEMVVFIKKWNAICEKGWMGPLLFESTKGKHITDKDKVMLGRLGLMLSSARMADWSKALALAVGVSKDVILNAVKKDTAAMFANLDAKEAKMAEQEVEVNVPTLLNEEVLLIRQPSLQQQSTPQQVQVKKRMRFGTVTKNVDVEDEKSEFESDASDTLSGQEPRLIGRLKLCDELNDDDDDEIECESDASDTLSGHEPERISPTELFGGGNNRYPTSPRNDNNLMEYMHPFGQERVNKTQAAQNSWDMMPSVLKATTSFVESANTTFVQSARKAFGFSTDDKATQVDQAITVIHDHLKESNNSGVDIGVMGLAVEAFDLAAKKDVSQVFEVKFKPRNGKKTSTRWYSRIPLPRKSRKPTTTAEERKKHEESKKRTERSRVSHIQETLDKCCNDENEQKGTVTSLVENRLHGEVNWKGTTLLDVDDVIVIREVSDVSTNTIVKIITAMAKSLGLKRLAPTLLKKKISKREYELPEVKHVEVYLEVEKGKYGHRVFYFIPNVALLCERLVASTILEGKQEDSISFSNYKNTQIFFRGIDKGGDDVIDMIRDGNRENGNSGMYCMPTGVAESASETLDNLKKTVLHKKRNKVQSKMQEQKCRLFEILLKKNEEGRDLVTKDVRCMMVELNTPSGEEISDYLEVDILDNEVCTDDDVSVFYENSRNAGDADRDDVDQIHLQPEMLHKKLDGTFGILISLQMVQLCTSVTLDSGEKLTEKRYIGCKIYCNDTKLYAFKFDTHMSLSSGDKIQTNCKKVMCIPAQDGKMTTMVFGLGTCGVTYSCVRCLRRRKSEYECKDYPLREGEYSYEKCYQTFLHRRGKNSEYTAAESSVPKTVIEDAKSVLYEPEMKLHPNLHSGDELHLHMGYVSHLTEEYALKLRNVGGSNTKEWTEKKKEALKQAEAISDIEQSDEYLNAKRSHNSYSRRIAACRKKLKKAEEKTEPSTSEVEGLEEELSQLLLDMQESSNQSGFGLMNRKIRGAKEFTKVLGKEGEEANSKKKKLEEMNAAEFLFLQGIRTKAGKFNKQHGSMELTAARGMRALEHRQEICNITCKAFENTNPVLNARVKKIMDNWKTLAYHLFEMGKLMKSQQKMTPDRLERLEHHLVHYAVLWRQEITYKNPVFWKMHICEDCFYNFVKTTGMSGRASSEGFEHKHFVMRALKAMLASIVKDSVRVNKLSQRQQIFLLPGLTKKLEELQSKFVRKGPRGPYKNKGLVSRDKEDIELLDDDDDDSDAPEGFFELEDGGILSDDFAELYNFYKRSLMPEEWRDSIESNENLGTKAKLEAQNF